MSAPPRMPAQPVVQALRDEEAAAWDRFVREHPRGTFFHLAGWREVVGRGLGHSCHFLVARREGAIAGVLPLVELRSPLFGSSLIGTGFTVGGGVLASDPASETALYAAAESLARARRIKRIELRAPAPERPHWQASAGLYFGFRKPLQPDPERNYQALRRKQRAMIRKGLDSGLRPQLDQDVSRLYEIYAASVHRLGTPVLGRAYFRELKRVFSADCEILTLVQGERPIASVMAFYYQGEVLPYYGGSLPEGRAVAANDVMYHELMRRAVVHRGARLFDFGRSKAGTGAFEFKRHWGFEPAPLTYSFWLPQGGRPPEINPLNAKYRPFIDLWRRQPFWLSKLLGPPLARQLG